MKKLNKAYKKIIETAHFFLKMAFLAQKSQKNIYSQNLPHCCKQITLLITPQSRQTPYD
jgi:hypothetical protein